MAASRRTTSRHSSLLEVERDAPPRSTQRIVRNADHPGPLDPDHLRAMIGQHHRRERPGPEPPISTILMPLSGPAMERPCTARAVPTSRVPPYEPDAYSLRAHKNQSRLRKADGQAFAANSNFTLVAPAFLDFSAVHWCQILRRQSHNRLPASESCRTACLAGEGGACFGAKPAAAPRPPVTRRVARAVRPRRLHRHSRFPAPRRFCCAAIRPPEYRASVPGSPTRRYLDAPDRGRSRTPRPISAA